LAPCIHVCSGKTQMKLAIFKAFVLLLWAVFRPVAATRSNDAVARAWLRDHRDPAHSGDDLEELKSVNPNAFAIVKALLMKRQLGLLDPKHPTHSFSKPVDEDAGATSAPVDGPGKNFQSLSSPSDSGAMDKPHHNWLNWKPQDSAANDEAMVSSVLGAVADLKGAKAAEVPHAVASSETIPQLAAETRLDVTQPQNSYLKALDGQPEKRKVHSTMSDSDTGAVQPAAAAAANPKPKHDNSYLNAIGIVPASKKSPRDYLASFRWDDEDQRPAKVVAARGQALRADLASVPTAPSATPQAPHDSSLLTWLGGSKISKTHLAPLKRLQMKPTPKLQPENKYLADLQ